jgi:16S rRNA processing protein RimM
MGGSGLVLMGRVAGAFGVKGEIKVFPFGRDPGAFARAGLMLVGPNPASARPLTLAGLREHGGRLLVTVPEVQSREAAAKLGGLWVYLRETDLAPLDDGEYYWYQLKDALVVDSQGNELGRVKEIADLGAHDLLLVRAQDGKEALIPVVDGVVLEVRAAEGLVVVDPPPGLLESQGWGAEPEAEPGDGPGDEPGGELGDEPGDGPGGEPGAGPGDGPGDEPGDEPGGEQGSDSGGGQGQTQDGPTGPKQEAGA